MRALKSYLIGTNTIEEALNRDLPCLANLANDDIRRGSSLNAAEHYHRRLSKALANSNRRYMITELREVVLSTIAERGILKPTMATSYEFQSLRAKADDLQDNFSGLLSHLSQNDPEVDKFEASGTSHYPSKPYKVVRV